MLYPTKCSKTIKCLTLPCSITRISPGMNLIVHWESGFCNGLLVQARISLKVWTSSRRSSDISYIYIGDMILIKHKQSFNLTVEIQQIAKRTMSRIIIKNIPKVFTEKEVTNHFKLVDEVTDCKIVRTPQGVSRGFGFVGFRNPAAAAKIKKTYDNTYIGTSKVRIDIAKLKDEEDQSRQRSRDQSKVKRHDKKEEGKTQVFEDYKKMIQEKSKKSWDDLIVPVHDTFEEVEKVEKQSKPKDKLKEKPQSRQNPKFEEPAKEEKPIKAPRLSEKNKKYMTKPLQVDSNRLYITNIPYTLSEEEIKSQFNRFGNITKIKLPKEYDGKNKGYFFLTFQKSEEALRAFSECDNKVYFGRIIHVKPSLEDIGEIIKTGKETDFQEKIRQQYGDPADEKSSYKKEKKREMREKYNDMTNWNTLFLNTNTVLERMAKKLHITKAQILTSDNLAPKVALAEAEVIQETKSWMEKNNINLEFLDKDRSLCERSKKTILVKNLNFKTQESELKELLQFYGILDKFMMAPNRAIAIAQFKNSDFAENALKKLQTHKFKNNFLFLEYAPVGMIDQKTINERIETLKKEEEEGEELSKVVYIKNLNFSSDEGQLYQLFQKIGPIKYTKIVRGKDGKSMGFGFAQYETPEKAVEAVKKLNNSLLDGHKLTLSLSRKKIQNVEEIQKLKEKVKAQEEKHSKLMIRNIAFQATKKDINDLFAEFGSLKKVRLPKKMDGQHRGFAFVEFDTADEAALAKEALSSAHLYGRKLVIEYEKGSN